MSSSSDDFVPSSDECYSEQSVSEEEEEESTTEESDSDSDYQAKRRRPPVQRKPVRRFNKRETTPSDLDNDEGSTSGESCEGQSDLSDSENEMSNRQRMAKLARDFKKVIQETWRNRPRDKVRRKFEKIEETPNYLTQINDPEMKLRDYQLEGLLLVLNDNRRCE